jgi:cysteinyl-tRNA synthetase
MLEIYNSLTKQKELFKPIEPGKVKLYVCGITAYDYSHIGHARAASAFDIIVRYFRYRGYDVTYVRNVTDVDDKIIQRALANNESCSELTERFIGAWHEDLAALNILPPDIEPLATNYITHMIDMIETLITKDYAYVGTSGDVYYRVEKFADYGKLAHKTLADLQAGARVSIVEDKDNPLDFVLWKMAKPGEPFWESPWGNGRPGWHIECSAMTTHCLGNHFDIHGGGNDLKFPHHENEIAQSEAATGEKFANYWVHAGLVNVDEEKMSKSLGNFFTIREVLARYRPEVIRYFLISSHYRSPINYSQESLEIATQALNRLYLTLRGLPRIEAPAETEYEKRFIAAMDDDFNLPEALAVLFNITHEINRIRASDEQEALKLAAVLYKLGNVLGLLSDDPERFVRGDIHAVDVQQVESLIAQRAVARAEKNWAEADRIRQQFIDMGIVVEDTAQGTIWRKE